MKSKIALGAIAVITGAALALSQSLHVAFTDGDVPRKCNEWTNYFTVTVLQSSNQTDWKPIAAPLGMYDGTFGFFITNDGGANFFRATFTPIP